MLGRIWLQFRRACQAEDVAASGYDCLVFELVAAAQVVTAQLEVHGEVETVGVAELMHCRSRPGVVRVGNAPMREVIQVRSNLAPQADGVKARATHQTNSERQVSFT